MTNQFVFRHGGRVCLEDLYEPASFQHTNCTLHCRFRKPGPFGKLLQAQCNAFLLFAKERRPQDEIHQKSGGSTIVTGQIRQEYVNDVFVNSNMLHSTIVYESIGLLPAPEPPSIIVSEATTMIRGVKFASIPVTDQDRALAFYTEKLGFRLLTDQPFNEKQRWIELGISGTETRVVLFRFDDGLQPGTKMNITFWTDDVERTVRELENKGVEFVMKPQKADWGTAAVFKDTDGNTFVLSSK